MTTIHGQFFLVLVTKLYSTPLQLRENSALTLPKKVNLTAKTPSKRKKRYQ